MEYDAIVIGAGVGGLTSALELAIKGKKILLLEKQSVPGGIATKFKRKGFTFEAALHYVDALGTGGEIRGMLDEFGISSEIEFIDMDRFGRVIYPEHDFVLEQGIDKLRDYLKKSFPDEKDGLDDFFDQAIRFYRQLENFTTSRLPLSLRLIVSPFLYPEIIKTSRLSTEVLISKKIKDKRARAIIETLWGFIGLAPSELSAFYFLIVFMSCWGEKTAFIKGGYSRLFSLMAEKIKTSGSQIKFNTSVKKIITDGNRKVKGVVTDGGEEFFAKTVISNASSIDTLTRLIDDAKIREYYAGKFLSMPKSISGLTVYLGLDLPAKSIGMDSPVFSINATYDHEENFRSALAGDYRSCSLALVDHSQLDPALAPPGKGMLAVMTLDSNTNWKGLSAEEYKRKKKEAADTIIARLEDYLPGLSGHIEVIEVGTPRTMERFSSAPEGAIYGFAHTVAQSGLNRLSQDTKIKGLFLCGAWTRPGCGVHACFISGRDAADLALESIKKR